MKTIAVCYFGGYNPNNSRNHILLKALRAAGLEVLECRDTSVFPINICRLFLKHWKIRKKYDVMLVAFAGQGMTFFAKLITRKPVVLDAFISLYNTIIEDRKLHSRFSIPAFYNYFLDWGSVRLADRVSLDTREHINYFVKKFRIGDTKFSVVPVGTDDEIFYPRSEQKHNKFIVGFHGTYIPLHGLERVIEAAEILKNEKEIEFRLLGNGQMLKKIKEKAWNSGLQNVKFYEERVPYEKLPEFIAGNDICLGIFGDTQKAKMVVPNKIYECAAMRKPIITQDSPAIREFFGDEDLELVKNVGSSGLAKAILKLKNNSDHRDTLAQNAYTKFRSFGTIGLIGKRLKSSIDSVIK